jgi:hypothetical protein
VSPDVDPAVAAWTAVLDELERAAAHPSLAAAWAPPAGLPPLPAALASRAAEVQAAQRRAASRLTEARRSVAAHLGAVGSAAPAPSRRPVYLDVSA